MKITHLNLKVIGQKHTAPFKSYSHIFPEKVEQTKQRMQELGIDKNQRYIIYEPQKHEKHETGFFYTGVSVDNDNVQVPNDMDLIHLYGKYAVLETIFDASRMGEYYTALDEWIYRSDYSHARDRFIIELYVEMQVGSQELIIFMPVVATLSGII
ncbi:GyrI-like domain-containing protein [Bacillus sp. FJAT-50079]|uniref:GyrI-like domain-containing protein n=1 Tax=Bacillus sp. FJAT-50079 TaxID=2833577 RepID=UPI001BCA5DC0|nr:GyrI-like domain-containing protein [Bacillus sp. FJAT-50079]MBS4209930.1 GyrI-like domain-containing protein [Bacillus sp. FJAT-50079]